MSGLFVTVLSDVSTIMMQQPFDYVTGTVVVSCVVVLLRKLVSV
ncbi:hypothetical protein [Clostridium beijerinckii]|nr:hypothetical protein [Clostridium beijerinckii]